jgi:ABC-type glycerol-3-phosphate transport system substrate-binding protein
MFAVLLALLFLLIPLVSTLADSSVVLRIWKGPHTPDDKAIFGAVITDFQASHPNVTIEYTPTPWDTIKEKYTTAFASGNPPDLIYGFTGGYVDNVMGKCWDYRKLFSKEEIDQLMTGVDPGLLSEMTLDGKLLGIPFFSGGAAFVYNIDMLKKAGFDKPPDTVADLVRYAKVLTTSGQYGYGLLSYDTAEAKPEFFLFAYGCNLFNENMTAIDYDRPAGLEAFKLIDKLWNKDKSAVPIGLYPGTTMTDAFFAGKFAMWVTHSQVKVHLKDNPNFRLGVAKMPKGPGTQLAGGRGTYVGSAFWAIPQSEKNIKEVKEFVKFIYQPKYVGGLAEAFDFIPSSRSIKIKMDAISQAFADAYLSNGVPYRFGPHVNEVKEAVWRAMQALQAGAIGPEQAWQQAVKEGKDALTR